MREDRILLGARPVVAGDAIMAIPASDVDDRVNLRDLVALLRRRLRLIAMVMATVLGVTLVLLSQATPQYKATALLLVDPNGKDLLQPANGTVFAASISPTGVEIEVEIIRSDAVLLDLIAAKDLVNLGEYGPTQSRLDRLKQAVGLRVGQLSGAALLNETLGRVRASVEARRRGLTDLIALSFSSQDPDRAAELVNALAARYIAFQVRAKSQSFIEATQVLESQLTTAQNRLAASDDALTRYLDQNLGALEREADSQAVSALQVQLANAETAQREADRRARAAETALRDRDWDALLRSLETDAVRALLRQRESFARRLGVAGLEANEAFDLRAGLDRIERELTREGAAALATARGALAKQTRARDRLRAALHEELLASDLTPETLSHLYRLQQEATIAQRQYDALLGRIRDLEAQALVQVADTRIVSPAIAPAEPSSPNVRLVLSLALVASLGVGVGLAFLNEYYVGGIHSASQLAHSTGARVGSVIPRIRKADGQASVADAVVDTPMSHYAESLRRLRASIDRTAQRSMPGGMVVMITSALPVEGKTATSLALARTYAMAGKRTLLIDADLRKPTLASHLGATPQTGLFEYLSGQDAGMSPEQCFDVDARAALGVIFGRDRSGAPTDVLFQSDRFRALLDDARESFDVIVVDTPPVIPVVDTRYIAGLVDITVLCVRAGETAQSAVRQALEQLADHSVTDEAVLAALTFQNEWHGGARQTGYYYS